MNLRATCIAKINKVTILAHFSRNTFQASLTRYFTSVLFNTRIINFIFEIIHRFPKLIDNLDFLRIYSSNIFSLGYYWLDIDILILFIIFIFLETMVANYLLIFIRIYFDLFIYLSANSACYLLLKRLLNDFIAVYKLLHFKFKLQN